MLHEANWKKGKAESSNGYDFDQLSLSDKVHHYIKDLILAGELKAGERVPEIRVAERFGVSRTPIREALKRLEEYGLIYTKPRSYAEVASLPVEEAGNVARVRASLETLSVKLLAECGTREDFDYLDSLAEQCSELIARGDVAETFEKDSELHLEFARRSRNMHLYELFEKFDAKVQLLRLVLHLSHEELRGFIGQHKGIIEAIRDRDPELAQQRMEDHILGQLEFSPNCT